MMPYVDGVHSLPRVYNDTTVDQIRQGMTNLGYGYNLSTHTPALQKGVA